MNHADMDSIWVSITINSFLDHGYLHFWSISPPVRAPQRVHDNHRKFRGLTSRAIDPSMYARRRPSFKLGEHILDTFVLAFILIDDIYRYIPRHRWMQSKQHQGLVHRNYIQRLELGDYFCIARVFNKYFIVIIYSIVVRTPIVKRIRKLWAW